MKNQFKLLLVALLAVGVGYLIGYLTDDSREVVPINTVVRDTVTHWQYDTLYIHHYDTITYHRTDTVIDYENGEIVLVEDTVQVPIPISVYKYDTTITKGDSIETNLGLVIEGYGVKVDTLSLETKITQNRAVLAPKKWHWGFGLAIGFGYVR